MSSGWRTRNFFENNFVANFFVFRGVHKPYVENLYHGHVALEGTTDWRQSENVCLTHVHSTLAAARSFFIIARTELVNTALYHQE